MRYIPERSLDVVFQVPEDLNSYINVLNVGATGLGNIEFTGTITDIQDDVVTVSGIQDGLGGTITDYRQILIPGVDIELFAYGTSTLPQPPPHRNRLTNRCRRRLLQLDRCQSKPRRTYLHRIWV